MKRNVTSYAKKSNVYCSTDYILYSVISLIMAVSMIVLLDERTANAQTNTGSASSMVQIVEGDEWHYFKGIQKPPRGWNSSGFDQNIWQKGLSGFGYGPGTNRTYLSDMKGNYLTVYARKEFIIGYQGVTSMGLTVVCDGPFIAYLDGIEVIRTSTGWKGAAQKLDISGFAHELVPGVNVLSVECSNDDINSSDFSFIPTFEFNEKQGGL